VVAKRDSCGGLRLEDDRAVALAEGVRGDVEAPVRGVDHLLVVVGLPGMGATITIPPFLWGERMITSSTMGTTRLSVDVPKLVDLYKAGQLKLDELITAHYPLEQINEAIESVERGEALRNIITF